MNILLLIIVIVAVILIGGGIGLLFYYRMRPKRETWTAYVYGVGEGIKELDIDKDGQPIGKFKLKDLIPYKKDVLLKIHRAHGITVYKLASLGYTTQQPPPDAVDLWGSGERVVNVLLIGNNATILRQGYDVELGERIFRPVPRERLEMVISEAEIKINELDDQRSLLQQALPWIGVGIMALSFVGVAYFMGQGIIEGSKNNEAGAQYVADSLKEVTELFREELRAMRDVQPQETENNIYGKQPDTEQEPIPTIK